MPHSVEAISREEIADVKKTFNSFLNSLRPKLKGNDRALIRKAFELANDAHRFQRRKSGEPYIFHPLAVAKICDSEIGLGPTAIICAILHDVVEDTPIELSEIFDLFGPKITNIVDGLTKLDGSNTFKNPNAENLKKVLSSIVHDVRVVLIKMADRLHNLRTIGPMPQHKQLRIAAETMYIYAPLAHRLGLYTIKTEFEDICMKITEPEQYAHIKKRLTETEDRRKKYIRKFLRPISAPIRELGVKYRMLSRQKAISSIWRKIQKKKVTLEEIYDLYAVRIIVNVPRQKEKTVCWQIYSIITDHYRPIPERLKDWITTPKGNGYESLHTTVIGPMGRFVEVQIRSERMDDIAERGFAAHWKYKGLNKEDNVYDKWLENIRNLLENQGDDAVNFLNDFKSNLFKEEVYVFTPTGDMRILPKGATALDFGFDIHSDVGAKAVSFKVNGKLVPMGYVLENGDQIHVNTSKNQNPTEDWLKIVITGKARSKIRSSLNEEKKKQAEFGKEMLLRKLKNMKVDFEENTDEVVSFFDFKNRPELYLALANERIKVSEISKHFEVEQGKLVKKEQEEKKEPPKPKRTVQKPKQPSLILIDGEEKETYKYVLSPCCNPVQGDKIFAFMTTNSGLKIHRFNCSNASNLFTNYDYRILKAEWATDTAGDFVVELLITGIDSGPGVIQKLSHEISNNLGVNIRSFNISAEEGLFEGRVKIVVKDNDQLNNVMKQLRRVDGISAVERQHA